MKNCSMLGFYRRSFLVVLVALVVVVFLPRSVHSATVQKTCQSLQVPVALSAGQPALTTIYGQLCLPSYVKSNTVQLLIPGATYGHIYWDFSYQPQIYSYVQALTAAGYSTFNIDPLGVGLSSHPDLSLVNVTVNTEAFIVHQIVQDLHTGLIGNHAFTGVLLVGHSLGSGIVWIEAGTYHDVDGVIITGLVHHLNSLSLARVLASFYPADLDPRFADTGTGLGYITTEPGTRAGDFYYLPSADPNVIATDEATKETATDGEARTFAPVLVNGISTQITAPVLLVVGQQDSLTCGPLATDCSSATTLLQAEAPYYASQAQLQVAVIPNSGHDLALHETAPFYFAATTAWAYQYVAP
jgi:pimeloyl-ACP methyl ester carboxylesterase